MKFGFVAHDLWVQQISHKPRDAEQRLQNGVQITGVTDVLNAFKEDHAHTERESSARNGGGYRG